MKKYNAWDNQRAAESLLEQLQLELADYRASMQYAYATTVCDDCPMVEREPDTYDEMEFGVRYAPTCCKHDGSLDEQYRTENEEEKALQALINAIIGYLIPAV